MKVKKRSILKRGVVAMRQDPKSGRLQFGTIMVHGDPSNLYCKHFEPIDTTKASVEEQVLFEMIEEEHDKIGDGSGEFCLTRKRFDEKLQERLKQVSKN